MANCCGRLGPSIQLQLHMNMIRIIKKIAVLI